MVATTTHFPKQKAPCGHMVDGDHHIERDDEGLAYDDLKFSCGCREIRHFYHDAARAVLAGHYAAWLVVSVIVAWMVLS